MKKSLITTSVAILLASTSAATFASNVTIPNTFDSGTPAVAAEVNENFDAVAVGVNDNDSRVTINTGNISTNTTNVGTNTGNITTNSDNIDTNTTAINDLQSGLSCPDDMTAVGSICVDTYEASLYSDDALTNQLDPGSTAGGVSAYPCTRDGDDCGAPAATAIYAGSVAGVTPANWVTWYQAVQACANVGKRLPTTAEWQMAALGTPSAPDCNIDGVTGELADTDAFPTCLSPAGVVNMVGNVMELSADLDLSTVLATPPATNPPTPANSMDAARVPRLGNSYDDTVPGLTTKANSMATSTRGYGPQTGFRCVK